MYLQPRQNAPPSLAPPGVIPNYNNPNSIGDRIIVSNSLLGTLAFVFVSIRMLIKCRILENWGWEDVFILIALVFAIARIVMEVLNVKLWQLGVHVWDIAPQNLIYIGNHQKNAVFIADMLYFFGIMFTKLSILTLYVKLFQIKKVFRYLAYGMMAFTVVYLTIFFFLFAFNCNPPAKTWNLIGWSGGGTCFDNIKTSYAVGGINIFTDVVILIMPLPLLYSLQLDLAHRLGLIAIFGTGILVVICTIVRQIIIVKTLGDFDQSRSPVSEIIWLTAELCVGIICACLPTMAPLYSRNLAAKLLPTSLRNYLISLRASSTGTKGSSRRNVPSNALNNPGSESDIELVDAGKYTNIENTRPQGHIKRTKEYSVDYTQNVENTRKPGNNFDNRIEAFSGGNLQ